MDRKKVSRASDELWVGRGRRKRIRINAQGGKKTGEWKSCKSKKRETLNVSNASDED